MYSIGTISLCRNKILEGGCHAIEAHFGHDNVQPIARNLAEGFKRLPLEDFVENAAEVATSKFKGSNCVKEVWGKRKSKLVIFVHEHVLALCL